MSTLAEAIAWHARRAWLRVRASDLVIMSLAGTWLALWYFVTAPLKASSDAAQLELQALYTRESASDTVAHNPAANDRDALGNLVRLLPPYSAREETLSKLGAQAEGLGLSWEGAEYSEEVIGEMPLLRTIGRISIRGDYASLRRYVALMLQDHPNLAISQLTLDGDANAGSQPTLTVEVHLFFHRADVKS